MITVTVVYANPEQQKSVHLQLDDGTTVEQAIYRSALLEDFTEIDLSTCKVGIFSKQVNLAHRLATGDRVEIYRPLLIDPKQARRRRVAKT